MKIAYCGYDFFKDCLDRLIKDGHELVEVFSYPTDNKYDFNDHIFSLASSVGAPVRLGPCSNSDIDRLAGAGCDLLLSAAYPYKIPVTGKIRYMVNLHPSPLPLGRGAWPLPYAILSEQKSWGVTYHEINSGWDAGDILHQESFHLTERESLESISVKCQLAAGRSISWFVSNLDTLWAGKSPQSGGSYIKMPTRQDKTIDWNSSVFEIERKVRAFSKFEARGEVLGKTIYIRDVNVWEEVHGHKPGELIAKTNKELVVAAKNGIVCIRFWDFLPEKL